MFGMKRKAEKMEKATNRLEKNLNEREEAIQKRKELKKRNEVLRKRKSDIGFTEELLTKEELRQNISEVKGDLWFARDKIYNGLIMHAREIAYINRRQPTPGGIQRKNNLEIRIKNNIYALTLIEEALQRIDDAMTEYEWNKTMRDLTNGYKAINSFSKESTWLTKFRLRFNKIKFDINEKSTSASTHAIGIVKPIDTIIKDENILPVVEDILVKSVDYNTLTEMDKNSIFEAARNGVFVNVQPEELRREALAAEEEVKMETGQTDVHFNAENEPLNFNSHSSNLRKLMEDNNK